MKKFKLGIIGVGNMGSSVAKQVGLQKLCPNIELVAICDKDPDRIDWAKETFKDEKISYFSSADELYESGEIDMVYIAVPHYDHPSMAIKAFERNIHVMLEKPAGVYTKAVREMNEASEKSNAKFGIMFQCRTYPAFIKVKELLSSGQYGQIRSVSWIITNWYRSQLYYDSGSWRATWAGEGGGVLINQCPHNLDIFQWLCGMPVEVTAKCSVAQWHDVEIEDDVTAIFKFENGALGSIVTSTGIAPGSNRLEIATDRGTIIVDNCCKITIHELVEKEQDFAKKTKAPFATPSSTTIEYKDFYTLDVSGHPYMLNRFAEDIMNEGKMVAEGKEGINSLTLSNAMYLSSWLNKTIELPIDEDLFYEELQKRVATSKIKNVKSVVADVSGTYQK